ncbi:MAG: hypothetical protein RLY14_1673 [Planctomycetota bacterium]|jgi:hypothetical protein
MKQSKINRNRRKSVADREVQYALGKRLALHWVVFIAFMISINLFISFVQLVPEKSFSDACATGLIRQIPLLVSATVLIPLFLRDALLVSNRFAGPMVRLRKSIQGLANGEKIPPLVFRQNDYWMESATEFNRLRQFVLGLYRDLDLPSGVSGSEQLAMAAQLAQSTPGAFSFNTTDSAPLKAEQNSQVSNTSDSDSKQETPCIYIPEASERRTKPSRYVNDENASNIAPLPESFSLTDIPVTVSSR